MAEGWLGDGFRGLMGGMSGQGDGGGMMGSAEAKEVGL